MKYKNEKGDHLFHFFTSTLFSPFVFVAFLPCLSWTFAFSGSARGRWYKFNDTVVEEFDMNDETLEYECFGGEYRPKVYDQCKQDWRVKKKQKLT